MIKKIILLGYLFVIISCGDSSNDIYKAQSGEYASPKGNFIIKFPVKPNYGVINNQIGLEKFKLNLFTVALGANKTFSLEYVDYPKDLFNDKPAHQIFKETISGLKNRMGDVFYLASNEEIVQHGITGRKFILSFKEEYIERGARGHIEGRLFKINNRIYTLLFKGLNNDHVKPFMDSFRLLKKESEGGSIISSVDIDIRNTLVVI